MGKCLFKNTNTDTALKLILYKWLFRTYVTPVKLHQYNPNIPDNCTKCNGNVGTLLHCMWECQVIHFFWKGIVYLASCIAPIEIPLEAKLCIFGIYPDHFATGPKTVPLIKMCLLQARRVIARRWTAMRLREMASCLALKKLTYVARGKSVLFLSLFP